MDDKYPQILVPDKIHLIKKMNPPIPDEPIKPSYPKKEILERPKEPDKPFGIGVAFLIFIVLIVLGIGLGFVVPFLGLIVIGIAISLVISWSKNWSSIHTKYKNDYNQFLKDSQNFKHLLANHDLNYNKKVQNYYTVLLPQYETDYSNYLRIKKKYESEASMAKYRKEQLSNYFSEAVVPQQIESTSNYTKGVSEQFFLKYLKEYFNGYIKINFTVIDTEFGGIPYFPDYVISIPEMNLYIDIEIDEPYIGHDGTPIHYTNGFDKIRNDFFLKKHWLIIRFAEVQVIKYPNDCCEIIKSTINWLLSNNQDLHEITQQIKNFICWSKEEAHRLAFIRFRNKYLPKKLIEGLDSEIMELEKKFLNITPKDNKNDLIF